MVKPVTILVINGGSSSHKACLYDFPDPVPPWQGLIDWTKEPGVAIICGQSALGKTELKMPLTDRSAILEAMLATMGEKTIAVVGHRVVHGGRFYQEPVIIDDRVKSTIQEMAKFAPVHNPINLEGIELATRLLPHALQVAVFDTAFHSRMPPAAKVYPLPYQYYEMGVYRYGFHGISHGYVAQKGADFLNQDLADLKLITCHLGNGCSIAAVDGGISINTTMGFTPLGGVMMGTRSGDLDPGILTYLLRQGLGAEEIDRLLNRESGLLGVSGISSDLRTILGADGERARLAYDIFIHRLRGAIGSMVANLGGLDALIFTAGIGENSAKVRADVCANWQFWGITVDPDRNSARPCPLEISEPGSRVKVLVIPTQEDWAIAQACYKLQAPA